jgi:molybdenum cofactor biosynthesis enzyme
VALDKSMTITEVRLEEKTGGKSATIAAQLNPKGTS